MNIILCPRGVLAPPLDSCLSLCESRIRRERRFDSISRFKRRKKTENRDGYWAVARVQMPTQAHTLNFIFSFYLSPQPNRLLIIPKKKERRRRIIMFALLGIDSDRSAKPKMPEPLRGIGFCLEGMNQNLYTK